jgi:hypothetical protein
MQPAEQRISFCFEEIVGGKNDERVINNIKNKISSRPVMPVHFVNAGGIGFCERRYF